MSVIKRKTLFLSLALSLVAVGTAAAWAEDVFVKADSVDVRAGKGAIYPLVAHATKGAKLTVVDREPPWVKVQVAVDGNPAPQQGYVYENALSKKEIGGGGKILASYGTSAVASNLSTGNASKNLVPKAEEYARTKNLSPVPLQKLVDDGSKLSPEELAAFQRDGHVGTTK